MITSCSKSKYDYLNQESQIITRSITEHQTPFINWEDTTSISINKLGNVILPWYNGSKGAMPFYILNDYKKEDGWELVYNFCSDNIANQEGGKNFLIFYNILTGKLRVFYYNENIITGGNATVAAFRTESPTGLFDYCNSYIDNVTDIPKYKEAVRTNITTFESKATNLGWNCFDISVAYDPNNYPDYMNIGFYDQNIKTINLSGLINLSSSGTVTSTNVSNPVSWLVDLVGEEGGKKVEEIWNTSIRKKDAEETNRIIGGIAQKLITSGLFKIFGSAIMKLNKTEEVSSSIELTTSGNLSFKGQILSVQASPIPSMQKLLMPGVTPKSTDDILPLYNKKNRSLEIKATTYNIP